jgi:hypothetical protein
VGAQALFSKQMILDIPIGVDDMDKVEEEE